MDEELAKCYSEGRPYFGEALLSEQGSDYFEHFGHIVEIARRSTGEQRVKILEVGSWAGHSIIAWHKAAQSDCDLTCIDHWQPYFTGSSLVETIMSDAARSGEIKKLFLHNVTVCGVMPNLTIMEGDCVVKMNELMEQGQKFDIVFIDGDHSYDAIRRDIGLSQALLVAGGVLCGDDLNRTYEAVINKQALHSANQQGITHICDNDGYGYHPGITQAVHELGGTESRGRLWFKKI